MTPEQHARAMLRNRLGWPEEDLDSEMGRIRIGHIAAAIRGAVAEEREACAKIADEAREDEEYGHAAFRCVQIAQDIRKRGAL